jgi:predicted esterase YcpF (UPF0227 family)
MTDAGPSPASAAARTGVNAPTHLLYLHGFRSSPLSFKARMIANWLATHRRDVQWWCPQLPISPREAMALVTQRLAHWPRDSMAVIGSSLGGFYATVVAERFGCSAVLLNPAVYPARDLAGFIGETTAWHSDERMHFRSEYVDEFRDMAPRMLTLPERYFAVIAKGDEVLDWHEMTERHAGCRIKLLDGGDHALSDFEAHLPDVLRFVGLA